MYIFIGNLYKGMILKMTTLEKLYEDLKNHHIEKYGTFFSNLPEKDQHNLIMSLIQTYIDKVKNEK